VLYGCSARAVGWLQHVQNYVECVTTQSNWHTPSQPLLQSLHLLRVQQRLVYKSALITYRVITTSTPSHLSDPLAAHIPAGPTRRSSTGLLLTVPYVASDFTRWSCCFVSPTVLNSLQSDVWSSPLQTTFKSTLKTHLFNIAFNEQPKLWCCVTSFHVSVSVNLWNWHLTRYKSDYYYYYYLFDRGWIMTDTWHVADRFGMLGSIDANTGSPDLGWDTDQFPTDVKNSTLVMKVFINLLLSRNLS